MLGHDEVGTGPRVVVVLNDWIGDTSTWDGARAYLDGERFTWAFTDLRGYGRSKGQSGAFTVSEAAADVIALADAQGWDRISVVGHSMSTLIALHLAQRASERIERVVMVTPPPPAGFGVDDATLAAMQSVGHGDDAQRVRALRRMVGERLSEGWLRFKAERWRATSDAEAVAGYVAMFARDGVPTSTARVRCPLLAVTGEHDAPPMRSAAVRELLGPLCDELEVAALLDCGHYPMQEAPPLLVATVERFLAGDGGRRSDE
jgi:pimeloyl-ACP methyl ester carboxylesterase